MRRNGQQETFDRAIDAAVCDMMHVDPRPGLSRRVLRRIERRSAGAFGGRSAWRHLRPAVLSAAAVLVAAVAVLSLLRTPATDRPTSVERVASPPPAAPAIPPAEPRAAQADRLDAPRVLRDRERAPESIFGPRSTRVTAADVSATVAADAPDADASPSLPVFDPITIPAIRIEPIAITPLTVPPLTDRR